jgi:hypothetical protein
MIDASHVSEVFKGRSEAVCIDLSVSCVSRNSRWDSLSDDGYLAQEEDG